MILLALDPGAQRTGVVRIETIQRRIMLAFDDYRNEAVLDELANNRADVAVCESITRPGKAGNETYQTMRWFGRFEQRALDRGIPFHAMRRNVVANHLYATCPRPMPSTPDARVRQALLTRYTKQELKHVKGHAMAALAVGVAWLELNEGFEGVNDVGSEQRERPGSTAEDLFTRGARPGDP